MLNFNKKVCDVLHHFAINILVSILNTYALFRILSLVPLHFWWLQELSSSLEHWCFPWPTMLLPKCLFWNKVLLHSLNRLKSLKSLKNRMIKFGGLFHPESLCSLEDFWKFADYFWISFLDLDSNSWCHLGLFFSTSFSEPEFKLLSQNKQTN